MTKERTQDIMQKIYEDNFSHIDFMDNMGGDCRCEIHLQLINLAKSIGITNDEWEGEPAMTCENCVSGDQATHSVITLKGEVALCDLCYNAE